MNLQRRIRIAWAIVWINRVRTHLFRSEIEALRHVVALASRLHRKSNSKSRFDNLMSAVSDWKARSDSFIAGLHSSADLTVEDRAQKVKAAEELLAESREFQTAISELRSALPICPPDLAVLRYVLTSMQYRAITRQRKSESFKAVISRIQHDNFYWDLLIWMVVPGAHSEDLLGDLNEEYLLRHSSEGWMRAKAWYQHQATTTISQYLWDKFERLAAIGAFFDWIRHWFRK